MANKGSSEDPFLLFRSSINTTHFLCLNHRFILLLSFFSFDIVSRHRLGTSSPPEVAFTLGELLSYLDKLLLLLTGFFLFALEVGIEEIPLGLFCLRELDEQSDSEWRKIRRQENHRWRAEGSGELPIQRECQE
jgi:hypothetical protein